jgi:hypothetical protein
MRALFSMPAFKHRFHANLLWCSRLVVKTALAALMACSLTCNNVEGPLPSDRPDSLPDTSVTDSIPPKDTTPPQAVTDAVLTLQDATREIRLAWTAPYDDSLSEAVTLYRIRYSLSYTNMQNWELTIPVLSPPVPASPGSPQQCGGFDYVERGKNIYAALKSVDEAGNESALSNIASVHIPGFLLSGVCTDAVEKLPVSGLSVQLLAGIIINLETGADGSFERGDLPRDIHLSVSTGSSAASYHTLFEPLRLVSDSALTIPMIEREPVLSGEYLSLLNLFKVLTRTNGDGLPTILRKWKRTPIRCYIPAFVNEHDIDYQALARQAAQRWMDATGWELFSFVDSPPDTGIVFEFRTAEEMGMLRGVTEHSNGSDNLPLLDTIAIADYLTDVSFVYRVCLHELGHAIRLGHVNTRSYIMYAGQPLPSDISADELAAMRLLRGLPNLTDMAMYDDSQP